MISAIKKITNSKTQIIICGEAGQGVILAGVMLAHAAMKDKKQVAQSARYGAAVRGGDATANVVIDIEIIDYPHIEKPDYLIALSQSTYDKFIFEVADSGLVIYDPFFVKPVQNNRVNQISIGATKKAIELFGKPTTVNIILLSVLERLTNVISANSLKEAVTEGASAKFLESNIKALATGQQLAKEVKTIEFKSKEIKRSGGKK